VDYEIREVEPVALEAALDEANADPGVHGILIYYPVFGAAPSFFGGSMDDQLRDRIAPEKDVEGLCHAYRSALYRNVRFMDGARSHKAIVPCTPLAVIKCLEHIGVHKGASTNGHSGGGHRGGGPPPLEGKVCTVVNRSEVVGRPLAAMLANDGATVYSVDIDSIYVMVKGTMTKTDATPVEAVGRSDVVVLGVPSKAYKLDADALKDGAVVINVSTFKNLDDSNLKGNKTYTYVPLVGRVTVACLERSLLTLYKQYHAPSLLSSKASSTTASVSKLIAKATQALPAEDDGRVAKAVLALVAGLAALGAVAVLRRRAL